MGPRTRNSSLILFLLCLLDTQSVRADPLWGGLYPRESHTREVKSLDGVWNFRLAPRHDPDRGFVEEWYAHPLSKTGPVIPMPVPSSYNDITQDPDIRDHVGWAWYDRMFEVPLNWATEHRRVFLRLGSARYLSNVFLNGNPVVVHEGGHLPIRAEVTQLLLYGYTNLLTVAVSNVLTPDTVPEGLIVRNNDTSRYPEDYFIQTYSFDFFNYAGIHRPVHLYTTRENFIDDIEVSTDVKESTGIINYNITIVDSSSATCTIVVRDRNDTVVAENFGCEGVINISDAKLWWPFLMSDDPGYLYTFVVFMYIGTTQEDIYEQKIGIRSIQWDSTSLYVNGKKAYLHGVGKHEDSDIRGKGLDLALVVKDFNLLKWLGVNVFRTTHYPYAEEIMDMADREGIMVIDECPAVSLTNFNPSHLETHTEMMKEMIRRDKNRPSVIMWSVANEPVSSESKADSYFRQIVNTTKSLDPTRPVTAAINVGKNVDFASKYLDVIMVNKYYSWYSDTGHLELIENQTITEFTEWYNLRQKPVMISEYGAGTIIGIHRSPAFLWSEEYQGELLKNHFKAFDVLREQGFFIGEMIWNFADFATPQNIIRVAGNRKGVLTRDRQPKLAAHILRQRYHALENIKIGGIFGGNINN
ncbi:beta-glucuronidase-like [Macrobrachium rosenbergii]|uniref:beta-glucuronidase-like n=1 Tax=Macrobrachium rosenbergii TaxID=79674 RepID=UPI0034D499A6